jgi:hypothetical protein
VSRRKRTKEQEEKRKSVRMHTQSRRPDIHRPQPNLTNQRSNRRPTRTVVPHEVLLQRYPSLCGDPTEGEDGLGGCGVTLVRVGFDCDAGVEVRAVRKGEEGRERGKSAGASTSSYR